LIARAIENGRELAKEKKKGERKGKKESEEMIQTVSNNSYPEKKHTFLAWSGINPWAVGRGLSLFEGKRGSGKGGKGRAD